MRCSSKLFLLAMCLCVGSGWGQGEEGLRCTQCEDSSNRMEEYFAQLHEMTEDRNALAIAFQNLKSSSDRLSAQASANLGNKETEIQQLKDEVSRLGAEAAAGKSSQEALAHNAKVIASLNHDIQTLKAKVEADTTTASAHKARAEQLEMDQGIKDTEIQQLKDKVSRLGAEAAAGKSNQEALAHNAKVIASLNHDIQTLKAKVEADTTTASAHKARAEQLEKYQGIKDTEIQQLKDEVSRLGAEAAAGKSNQEALAHNANLIASLNHDIQTLKAKVEADTTTASAHVARAEQLEKDKAALETRLAMQQQDAATAVSAAEVRAQSQAGEMLSKVKDLEAQLRQAKEESVDLGAVLAVAGKSVSEFAAASVEELTAVFKDVSSGNTTKLLQLHQRVHEAVISAVHTCYAFVVKEVDEHAPMMKKAVSEATAKAEILYKKHIAEASWVAEVSQYLNTANTELLALISKGVKSYPVMAPLNDPVYIQLMTYSVIGAPLLLLLLPLLLWLATCLAPASKQESGKESKKAASKKRPKPKAA